MLQDRNKVVQIQPIFIVDNFWQSLKQQLADSTILEDMKKQIKNYSMKIILILVLMYERR
jgi:hypothetical protein